MRRISTKIALPLILGLASIVAVACGTENPDPDGEGGSGGGTDIGDGEGGEPNTGGGNSDGAGGKTDGAGGSDSSGGGGGEGGVVGTGGEPIVIVEPELPDCDEPDGEIEDGPLDGDACWGTGVTCKGTDTEQFLQQCSGTCFEPFDNFARIEDFDGNLPPL